MSLRKPAGALCLAALALAFAQTGAALQRRVGLPRPRPAQPAQPATPSAPAEGPRQPAAPASPGAQQYQPAIEYQSFMELRFYENTGGFLVEGLEVVFPPPGQQKAAFVVARANGQAVATVPLRLETPLASFNAFGMYVPDGVPGTAQVGEAGDYVLSVQVDGRPLTTLPFSMKREASNDPFNPKTTFVREGPWRDLGYFSVEHERPESHLEFNWWTSVRELPPGTPSRPLVTLHIMHGGAEIAATRSPVVPTVTDWQFLHQEFVVPGTPVRWMTLADLTKKDGEYTVVAKVGGKPYKSYRAEVRGGQLLRHPRNALDTSPHTDFISPRLVDTSSRSTSQYTMRDTFWVRKL